MDKAKEEKHPVISIKDYLADLHLEEDSVKEIRHMFDIQIVFYIILGVTLFAVGIFSAFHYLNLFKSNELSSFTKTLIEIILPLITFIIGFSIKKVK